ncbi:DNA-binding protein [Niastella yeongjuensis]|uniref:DNA-binding protein n=1 Tax=Niastella yeongjuensis TaxID=354355 RepID=A0A1V9EG82_9BACT|nr:cold shock domain-containing protein [Niastella yeongjuensis]OQP45140.1 DNA-binding protein [Niastella yeongjuensis]SEP48617.1 cold-shock DNA-binding protein family [Niastella yeongjuensis]
MSKSQETFNKKEREKKRQRKQQDKQEKMLERKNNKEKKSLEDMMAYVDENGNLTSTPPDPKKKRIFRQEEMQISVPKQEERPANERRTGVVSFFNDHKGFGFINDSITKERIFVHVNELSIAIKENDKVTFEVQNSPKGLVALNVELVKS